MEKPENLRLLCPDPPLLAHGLSAAASIQSGCHFPSQLAQIPLPGNKAELVALFIRPREYRGSTAAGFRHHISQLPNHHSIQSLLEDHHVTLVYIIIRNAPEVRALLSSSGKVKAVFQGHYHPGHENEIDGIRYHTLPAMCEGEENRFSIIEL